MPLYACADFLTDVYNNLTLAFYNIICEKITADKHTEKSKP